MTSNTFPSSFDELFAPFTSVIDAMTTGTYPPYNLLRDGDIYTLQFAVAGFSREDLNVMKRGNMLTVSGTRPAVADDTRAAEYLYRGIANRAFSAKFRLANNLEVVSSDYDEGILSVDMEVRRGPDADEQVIPIY
jgi:molecular chaperone IbpA